MKLTTTTLAYVGGVAVFSAALLTSSACNEEEFLDVEPTGVLTEEIVSSAAGLENALVGVYAQLNGRGNRLGGSTNWVHGSIRGGDANKGTDPGDFSSINPAQRYELTPTDRVPSDKWEGMAYGIGRANNVIRLATNSEDPSVSEELRTNILAQARMLRAHYYFNLAVNFGEVPFIEETIVTEEINAVPRTNVFPQIEADLQFAADNLPETQAAVGKVNKWAALAYLGKVQLWQGNYEAAQTNLEDVIENGVTSNGLAYALEPNYANVFNAAFDNGPESVFAMQAAANTGSVNNANPQFDLNFPHNTGAGGPGGCCGFFQPSFDIVSSFRTTDEGLPLLDESYRDDDNRVVDDMGVASTEDTYVEDAGNLDPRLDHSVGRRGIPYLGWGDHPGSAWIRNQPNGGPFSPKKFVYYKEQENTLSDGSSWTRGYTAVNYNIIRFADVLLLAAEANIQTGDLERGRELINEVRARAANAESFLADPETGAPAANYVISLYDDSFDDEAEALNALRFERKLELSGEGHRFFDLIRWDDQHPGFSVAEYLNGYLDYENTFLTATGTLAGAEFEGNQDEYYPLPQTQIDLHNGSLTQNPGY